MVEIRCQRATQKPTWTTSFRDAKGRFQHQSPPDARAVTWICYDAGATCCRAMECVDGFDNHCADGRPEDKALVDGEDSGTGNDEWREVGGRRCGRWMEGQKRCRVNCSPRQGIRQTRQATAAQTKDNQFPGFCDVPEFCLHFQNKRVLTEIRLPLHNTDPLINKGYPQEPCAGGTFLHRLKQDIITS